MNVIYVLNLSIGPYIGPFKIFITILYRKTSARFSQGLFSGLFSLFSGLFSAPIGKENSEDFWSDTFLLDTCFLYNIVAHYKDLACNPK